MDSIDLVTVGIIAINLLVSIKGFNDVNFFDRYKFSVGAIKAGQKERMFSSGFLHVDFSHLFFNMFTLFFFAPIVIAWLGAVKFVIIYVISLIAGSLLSMVFHKDEDYYTAVGASGAVTGILYAAILLDPWMQINFIIPGWVFGIGYLIYSIYGMKSRLGNIGHTAHFGGAVGGYATTLILMPGLALQDPLMVGLLAIPIIALFVLQKLGKI
ncbi:rhomboid family intramembrane serine protease [Cellulophaga sp. HaHa_2_95]|uniref:rhomboid family intramembrane serine protease n=1 Tax=unclassified Cellulophaga TaxID=2634405 RepID=UPI001C4E8CB6|nr:MULTISPECIES: rhomboid family intramembrane serine protease [unclassified Cellulophaga]QXP54237.1 rhomboid family intramembrane serine protease [Cellulophaga sp. HaHa_2_1]QXP58110.1 rhomboid family intramembrane serine protease [Cellulophaga sp. HaHa_2_95]